MLKERSLNVFLIKSRNTITEVNVIYHLCTAFSSPVTMAPWSHNYGVILIIRVLTFYTFIDVKWSIKILCIKPATYGHYGMIYIIKMIYYSAFLPEFVIIRVLGNLFPEKVIWEYVFSNIFKWSYFHVEIITIFHVSCCT